MQRSVAPGRAVFARMHALLPFAFLAAFAPAPPPAPWPSAPREIEAKDAPALAVAFPESAQMQRRALAGAMAADDAARALAAVTRLADMGATLSPRGRAQVVPLIGAAAMARLAARFDHNAVPLAASKIFATVPATLQIIEGLAWDPRRRALYATSVHDHALARVAPGPATVAAGGDLGGLFGAVYDPRRNRIWAASAPAGVGSEGGAFAGLVAIDPASGAVARIPAPPGSSAQPGDVAVAEDGIVYASDGRSGAVYRCPPGCKALETWIPPGRLFSAQGMAVSADGKRLYVADYRYGLAAIERRSGAVRRVASDVPAMLDGIDGLVRHGRDLIAVQNGIALPRIVRLSLSRDGLRVVKVTLLEQANPAWGEPTLATVAGDRLLYVGDGQWGRFDDPAKSVPPRPTEIRALDLRAAPRPVATRR